MTARILLPLAVSFYSVSVLAQPNANFKASINQGCAPVVVVFQDQSTGNPTSWAWTFGNGNSSVLKNPAAVYTQPGTYAVTLTAANSAGSDTETKTAFVTVFANPKVNFSAFGATTGCAPLTVSFSNLTVPGTGAIIAWFWDFGDGTSSSLQNPAHTYLSGGSHNVSLVAIDANGCTGSHSKIAYVNPTNKPTASISSPNMNGCIAPHTVNFNNTTSGGKLPYTVLWDFGDGTTGTGNNPSHTYQQNGNYSVTIFITDANGCQDSTKYTNYVKINQVITNFTAQKFTTCVGHAIQFIDLSTGNPASWLWSFGDATNSNAQNAVHVYTSPGTYNVSLIASNPWCNDTETKLAYIVVFPLPIVNFDLWPMRGCAVPWSIQYNDKTPNAASWNWIFGNNTGSTMDNGTATYNAFGSYKVTLAVTNANGCTNIKSDTVKVGPPNAGFFTNPLIPHGCIPFQVQFFDTSSAVDTIIGWLWDFGDGTTSTQQHPSHIYTTKCKHTVTLVISTNGGCKDTISKTDLVWTGTPQNPYGGIDTMLHCVNGIITFTDSSTGTIDAWEWEFGNGASMWSQNAVYSYPDTGCFNVSLTVYNCGCPATYFFPDPVCVDTPVSYIGIDSGTAIGCSYPHTVKFGNTSAGAHTWLWNFGDGSTSTQWTPTHTYNLPGTYNATFTVWDTIKNCTDSKSIAIVVSYPPPINFTWPPPPCAPVNLQFNLTSTVPLIWTTWSFPTSSLLVYNPKHFFSTTGNHQVSVIVSNQYGCQNSLTKTVPIYSPYASFNTTPLSGCAPHSITITNTSTSFAPIASYFWSFGDGTFSNLASPTHNYPATGTYPVTFTVTDNKGCTDQVNTAVNVGITNAGFSMSHVIACPKFSVSFINQSTATATMTHLWDFGDGSKSTLSNPSHAFQNPGIYFVKLIVTAFGCVDSLSQAISIVVPAANFVANPDSASCPPLLVYFTDMSTPAGYVSSWAWNFGDGSTSVLPNPIHLYTQAGSYNVSLIVTAPTGCSDTLFVQKQVVVNGPFGTFSYAPDSGCVPLTVTFIASYQDAKSLIWDMGDGMAYWVGDTIVHTYTQAGKFFPLLILDDSAGCMVAILPNDSIEAFAPPSAAFSALPTDLCVQGNVTFFDQSTSMDPLVSWLWDFGDGGTSNIQNPIHYYPAVGTYSVSLIVETTHGCRDTLLMNNYIHVHPNPVAAFVVTDTLLCKPWTIQFVDSSTGTAPIVAWNWSFGDGTSSGVQNPLHFYVNPGNYFVNLNVTDANGCSGNFSMTYNVPIQPSLLVLSINNPACQFEAVTFVASKTGFQAWNWNFGDGTTGTGSTVAHTYTGHGYYDVTVTGTNIYGCDDTVFLNNYVFVDSVVAFGIVNHDSLCVTQPFGFIQQCYSDTTLSAWNWDFGDGTSSNLPNPIHTFSAPGSYTVILIVTSTVGCKDTFSLPLIDVYDLPAPPIVNIYSVSVVDGQSNFLKWQSLPVVGFDHYTLYRESSPGIGIWIPVDSFYSPLDTTFLDAGVNTEANAHCYLVIIVNECGYRSDLNISPVHCTAELKTTSAAEAIDLNWSHYSGWPAIDRYEIFGASDYNPNSTILLASLPGTVSSWRDSVPGCELFYHSYRIAAFEQGGNMEKSWSDTSKAIPLYILDDNPVQICQATVEDDAAVRVNWSKPVMRHGMGQILERQSAGASWQSLATLTMNDTTYLDHSANVHAEYFEYHVIIRDSCENQGTPADIGRSIFLSGNNSNAVVNLSWNMYSYWPGGISSHVIEWKNDQTGEWEILVTQSGGKNDYEYIPGKYQPEICYRVTAFENGGDECDSRSNITCIPIGPQLFAPNAFTPNGDNLNDEFLLVGYFIQEFEMQIYNRWGELVYKGYDLYSGWNGKFRGEDAQEDAYTFVANARGLNGMEFLVKGTVTLLR